MRLAKLEHSLDHEEGGLEKEQISIVSLEAAVTGRHDKLHGIREVNQGLLSQLFLVRVENHATFRHE